MRNDPRLSRATIDRITAVARQMGYDLTRNYAARRLALSKYGQPLLSYSIGLMFYPHHGFSHSNYFIKMHQGVLDGVAESEFEIHTSDTGRIEERKQLPIVYRRGDIDGVVCLTQDFAWENLRPILRSDPGFGNRPVVSIVEPLADCSSVYPDNYTGAYEAINHLLDLGHRHIIHFHQEFDISGRGTHTLRLQAYYHAYHERGLDPENYLRLVYWPFPTSTQSGRQLVEVLKYHPNITAVIAHDDQQALDVYKVLTQAGYHIPQDLSLLSYDDTDPVMDGRGNNILTTVRLPLTEVAMEGTKLLLRRIMGDEPVDREIAIPTELIVRRSTAPARRRRSQLRTTRTS